MRTFGRWALAFNLLVSLVILSLGRADLAAACAAIGTGGFILGESKC